MKSGILVRSKIDEFYSGLETGDFLICMVPNPGYYHTFICIKTLNKVRLRDDEVDVVRKEIKDEQKNKT